MNIKDKIVLWIQDYFNQNGKDLNAIIGISGGKDSSVCAALLVEALGKERVIGVLMPQGSQHDIQMSYDLVEYLGIRHFEVNIGETCEAVVTALANAGVSKEELRTNKVYYSNTPARIRMTVLYGVSAIYHGLVVNTCNKSEDYIGYSTKFGDSAGDFSPISDLLVSEVKALGRQLKLPEKFIKKVPEDGLSGKTDEDNLGFTYAVLDRYIETGEIDDPLIKEKIDTMHRKNLHKVMPMPQFIKYK